MSRIGEQIKTIRLQKGMSQKELGKKIGVAESFIKDVELGRKVISDAVIEKISKVFGSNLNDINFGASEQEEKEEQRKPSSSIPQRQAKGAKKEEVNEVWGNAFGSVLREVPVYTYNLKNVLEKRLLAVQGNKIEGHNPDKVFFIKVENDDMLGFRIDKDDIAFGHTVSEIEGSGIYLVQKDGENVLRQVKKLDSMKLLLVSNRTSVRTETVGIKEVKLIGKIDKLEIKL
jgi:transcriptional regulator with XRE-family HTH domain